MKKNSRNILIIVGIVIVFLVLAITFNFKDLKKDVYTYAKGIVTIDNQNYSKLYNDDFSYVNLNKDSLENIAFLNQNNYFKDNIKIYSIDKDKVLYIDPFQDYYNPEEVYIYGGVYVNNSYYNDFLSTFDLTRYYKEISTQSNMESKEFLLSENESKIIKSIVFNEGNEERVYNGVKHDLSEFSYEIKIPSNLYNDIYLKIRFYRTKNNDLVIKFNDNIYYANEFKDNEDIFKNATYYTYKGDDYGYLYNTLKDEEDLKDFAFHDFILQEISQDLYKNYVEDVFKIINNEVLSLKDKTLLIKEILYSKYKPTLREDFPLRIERVKNLNIINDNRKTYRINHEFLFDIFNYPANLYALAFYEDDLLYNIPERYKSVYETYVNTIINDPNIDYLKKNDMIVEIQNALVVVDENQLKSMREKYGDIEVLEESNERIKYAPGYYGFLYNEIKDINSLREFALHSEVFDNISSEYFREIYTNKVQEVLDNNEMSLEDKLKNIVILQRDFTLIPIKKEKYYREKYSKNYFDESYITKVKSLIE